MMIKLIARTFVAYGVVGLLLFLGAGTLNWPSAWLFLVQMVVLSIGFGSWIARHDPALLKERLSPTMQRRQPIADKVALPLIMLVIAGSLVLIGGDAVRFAWSAVPTWARVLGELGLIGSVLICFRTMTENSFAAAVVKIQEDRGQTVISTGPYRYVRHPMYSGGLVFLASTSLLLGSWWGLAAVLALAALLAERIRIEEETLRTGLKGYDDYALRVRHRLIPLVW